MKLPSVVFTDIDGVWTDGGMYYDQFDNELKRFNTSDSAGVLFCGKLNIPVIIITGERTEIVGRRAAKLGIEGVFQGVDNKLEVAQNYCNEKGVLLSEAAYIGDDIGDIELLQAVMISGAPQNAPDYIRKFVHIVTERKGGEGAFREFVECILGRAQILNLLSLK